MTKAGEIKPVEIKAHTLEIDGRRMLQGFFRDVTEEVRYRQEQETTLRLLRLLNDPSNTPEMVRNLTVFLREWSGCEAVGVRLREGQDYPYFETRGFSPEFVEAEKWLCARDDFGQPVLSTTGNPVLECMCGNVLEGRVDPGLPFFTARGSFWTNSTTELLASTSEADRQARTRNRCHGEGYESVALVPLRYGRNTLGLLQMNDRQRDRFTPELIGFLERIADQIAMALSQRQAQAELRVSEQRYRDVLEASGEFIWESDPKGRLSYVSERVASILGYSPEELVGRSPFDFMAETDAAKLEAFLLESTQTKAGFRDLEHRIITRSDGDVWLSANGVPVLDATGELIGYRGTSRDITERKRAEEEMAKLEARLRQAQKLEAIGTLAGGIAHDFNNILTPIMGYTEMALGELPELSPMRYDLNQVLAAACRAKDLVKQILTFSRLNQDQLMRPVDISLVVKEALKLLRASLPTTIEIRQNIQKGMVVADATQIHQVIVNLCTNAAHAMEERGILEVSLTQVVFSDQDLASLALSDLTAGSYLRLSVRDTGHGMTGDIMEHIFEPYFTTKQVGEGTGLGLAVVHGIVKKHGGEIRVQSTPSVGSVFEVYLPLAAGEASREVGPSQSVPRGTESILLVDDEPMITEMGGRLLGQLGYSVTAKTDPREALGLMLANPDAFHLVITDYTMPYMTGIELAQGILKVKPGMPIILCTGFNERMSAEMVHEAGITELVIKPFDQKHLAELIRRILDPHEGSRELLRSSP